MGRQKLLLPFGEVSLLYRTLSAVLESGFEKTFVVVSRETKESLPSIKTLKGVEYVVNPDPDRGKDSSFHCGLKALKGEGEWHGEGLSFAVFLGDKPLITAEQILDLRRRFTAASQSALIPRKDGIPGHPAFYAHLWRERFLRSDKGARETLFRHAQEVQWTEGYESCFFDVDTEEDYRQLLQRAEKLGPGTEPTPFALGGDGGSKWI
jgi:molybdenum cofactor cytidylyltransferase